jgi:O-acetyl-ADP-ribose deacetylase (regulator of RNase III)
VGPVWQEGRHEEAELLTSRYRRAVEVAEALARRLTIAFPAISTGTFAFPRERAAQVAVATL